VFSWEAGKCVSYDDDLGTEWRHVAAVRAGGRLRLYQDGKRVAQSDSFDSSRFDLSNDRPLLIGSGPSNPFCGQIRDVRLYSRALDSSAIAGLVRPMEAAK
jgi:hypothetical protein